MYVITGARTWEQIQALLVGVCFFASKHPMTETVKKPDCKLAPGEVEFHLVTDMESELVYICLHSDGVCIQHEKDSALAEQVFQALRGHLVAAAHVDKQQAV